MIFIVCLNGQSKEYFENYDEMFNYITAFENEKLIANKPYFKEMNWGFTIHPPKHVTAFYAHLKDTCEAVKEASDENTSLIEICTGDYSMTTYIAVTPNVNLDYLKKKWCIDWCTFHHLLVREI